MFFQIRLKKNHRNNRAQHGGRGVPAGTKRKRHAVTSLSHPFWVWVGQTFGQENPKTWSGQLCFLTFKDRTVQNNLKHSPPLPLRTWGGCVAFRVEFLFPSSQRPKFCKLCSKAKGRQRRKRVCDYPGSSGITDTLSHPRKVPCLSLTVASVQAPGHKVVVCQLLNEWINCIQADPVADPSRGRFLKT